MRTSSAAPSIDDIEDDIRLCEEYLARDRARMDGTGALALSRPFCMQNCNSQLAEWAMHAQQIDGGDLGPEGAGDAKGSIPFPLRKTYARATTV